MSGTQSVDFQCCLCRGSAYASATAKSGKRSGRGLNCPRARGASLGGKLRHIKQRACSSVPPVPAPTCSRWPAKDAVTESRFQKLGLKVDDGGHSLCFVALISRVHKAKIHPKCPQKTHAGRVRCCCWGEREGSGVRGGSKGRDTAQGPPCWAFTVSRAHFPNLRGRRHGTLCRGTRGHPRPFGRFGRTNSSRGAGEGDIGELEASQSANLPGQQRQRAATAATAATAACATSARIARPGFVNAAGAPDWAGWAGQRPAIGRPGSSQTASSWTLTGHILANSAGGHCGCDQGQQARQGSAQIQHRRPLAVQTAPKPPPRPSSNLHHSRRTFPVRHEHAIHAG